MTISSVPGIAAVALLATLIPAVAAQRPSAGRPVVLTPQQRARLAALGWPPPPPVVRPRDDLVMRRDAAPVSGSLTTLHAFATVATGHGSVQIPRDEIGFVLVNRRLIPANAPAMPLDTDAVLLANGRDVLAGRVEVDGEVIHVGARTVQQASAAVIHLHDPKVAQQEQQQEQQHEQEQQAGGTGRAAARGAGRTPPPRSGPASGGPPSAPARPKGPGEIPWGQALWRGVVRFEKTRNIGGGTETEAGSYYVTWSEDTVGQGPRVFMIKFHPVSLVYQYAWSFPKLGVCQALRLSKSGSGIDGIYPDHHSGGLLMLPNPFLPNDKDAGGYVLNVFSPVNISEAEIPKTCSTGGPLYSASPDGQPLPPFSFGHGLMSHTCTSADSAFRAPPPFTTIAGEWTCQMEGTTEKLRWQFDRGIPPSDPTMSQDPCETARGLLSLTQDQRGNALQRLKQIRAEFTNARRDEARLRSTRNQLQGAFDLLIVASAGSNLGQKLLALVASDDMLETAAGTGQVTAAEKEFVGQLNGFIKSYQAWTEFGDDPGGWGGSQLLDEGGQDVVGEHQKDAIDAALEMFNYGQVIADAIGQGDGSAAGDYIEENLGAFGPLVPEYALSKARQYVEVSKQWSEALKTMARLAGEGVRLAGQISEADLGIKVRQRELQDCVGHAAP